MTELPEAKPAPKASRKRRTRQQIAADLERGETAAARIRIEAARGRASLRPRRGN